jgi:hypothetical protein
MFAGFAALLTADALCLTTLSAANEPAPSNMTNGVSCAPSLPGLVCWLPFSESNGPTVLNLAGGNYGTRLDGTAVAQVAAVGPTGITEFVGRGLHFDGVNDAVEMPPYPEMQFSTNDFSLVAWVKPETNATTFARVIAEHRDASPMLRGYSLFLTNGNRLGFELADGTATTYLSTLTVSNDGHWHHLAVTVQRDQPDGLRFYRDGVRESLVYDPRARAGSVSAQGPFRIGARAAPVANVFLGGVDEVTLFCRALSDAELFSLYQADTNGMATAPTVTLLAAPSASYGSSTTSPWCNGTTYHVRVTVGGYPGDYLVTFSASPVMTTQVLCPASKCVTLPVTTTNLVVEDCAVTVCPASTSTTVSYRVTPKSPSTYFTAACPEQTTYVVASSSEKASGVATPYVHYAATGQPVTARFIVHNPTSSNQVIAYRLSLQNPRGGMATSVAFDGHTAGESMTGVLQLEPGYATNLEAAVRFLRPDPLAVYGIVVETDFDGDGLFQPWIAADLANVIPPSCQAQFTQQPADVFVRLGSNAAFSVQTTGTHGVVRYQWRRSGFTLAQATNSTYSVSNIMFGHAADYDVVVRDDCGGLVSRAAHLSIVTNLPPSVALVGPTHGQRFLNGQTIPLMASAGDADGQVTNVAFFWTTVFLGQTTAAPYSGLLSHPPPGNYSLTAVATDNLGRSSTSAPVHVTVFFNFPPGVILLEPTNGQTFSLGQGIALLAAASDVDDAVTNVELYADSALLGLLATSPYTLVFSNAPPGSHALVAVAADSWGAKSTSAPVNVTVSAPLPRLTITRSGMAVTLAWSPNVGTLEAVDDLDGLWTPVTGATNPLTVNVGATRRFFRVKL